MSHTCSNCNQKTFFYNFALVIVQSVNYYFSQKAQVISYKKSEIILEKIELIKLNLQYFIQGAYNMKYGDWSISKSQNQKT